MQPGNRRVLSILYLEALEKRSILMLKALAHFSINYRNKALYVPPSHLHLFAHYFIISYANYLIASLQQLIQLEKNLWFSRIFFLSFSEHSSLRRVSVSSKEEFRCLSLSYSWHCTATQNLSLCAVHQTQAQPSFNISTNKSVILQQLEFSFDYKNKLLL